MSKGRLEAFSDGVIAIIITIWVLQMKIPHGDRWGELVPLRTAVGRDWKGKLSLVLYVVAIVASLRSTWIAQAIFVGVALIWLVPDRRIKRALEG